MADADKWLRIKAFVQTPPAAPSTANDDDTQPTSPQATPEPGQPAPAEPEGKDVGGALQRAGAAIVPQGLVERAANVPTPGDLTPLVIALLFFLFAIVPVGPGNTTRLQLIWRALTGGVKLPPSPKKQIQAAQAAQTNPIAADVAIVEESLWGGFWGASAVPDVVDAGLTGGLL